MNKYKVIILVSVITATACFFIFDLQQYFSFEFIKTRQAQLELLYNNNKYLSAIFYAISYIIVTALAIPIANVMVVMASAIAGLPFALVISSFAGAFGALFSFLITRYLFKDYFQRKFRDKISLINNEMQKNGIYYLFAMRVNPVLPFFLVNILISLTPMRARTFFWVSQIGMLPDTIILVCLGQQLSVVNSLQDIMSPTIIILLTLLGVFPLLVKFALGKLKKDISNV